MDNLDFNFFCSSCQKSREYRAENCFTSYRVKRFERGDYIAFKGNKVRDLALLVSGSLTVTFPLPSGIVLRSMYHAAPYPLGALALLGSDNRYRVDVTANEDCQVIIVSREEIEKQIMTCREFMLSFIDYSTSKVDMFVEHLTLLSQRSLAAKLAYYIFISSEDGKHYKFSRSIRGISEYLCVERPSLSRVIAKFVDDGLITYHDGAGDIVNIKGLKALIE
ncbi:MAG: Crp/Fnr family transcriptional regulator [Rikenellaceae bacterium]